MSLTVERVPIPDRTLERVAIPDSKLAREITKEPKPDLTRAMKSLDKRQFETIVGLKGNLGTGVMPAWGDNPQHPPVHRKSMGLSDRAPRWCPWSRPSTEAQHV
jgi:hypothetical protein